jgi:hypothetical protein
MTATGTLLVKYRLSTNTKTKSTKYNRRYRHQIHLLKSLHTNPNPMSKNLVRELDFKMQQVREYGLITHGYHNENLQYPVHVRRSHDGEKIPRTAPIVSNSHKKTCFSDSTILTPSSHENRTKIKQKDLSNRQFSYDERYTTLIVPPNKTVDDINPFFNCDRVYTHRKSSLSLKNSSPIFCTIRPHSIAGMSLPTTDEQQINSLSNSSQSLINQSPPIKTLTQRLFSKLFHQSSKS